jgi:hypothetical protein
LLMRAAQKDISELRQLGSRIGELPQIGHSRIRYLLRAPERQAGRCPQAACLISDNLIYSP